MSMNRLHCKSSDRSHNDRACVSYYQEASSLVYTGSSNLRSNQSIDAAELEAKGVKNGYAEHTLHHAEPRQGPNS